jgi:uncharacterized protein YdeI (YjbR/CyaY-like superfamily)
MRVKKKAELPELEMKSRQAWRRWLERNHASSAGVWLVFHKQHTGVASIVYDDSVREALCFGWIDSLVKRLDYDRFARKFTPRKPGSAWSESNLRRWAELDAAGELAPAGRAASPEGAPVARPPSRFVLGELPGYISEALARNRKARIFFDGLPPGEKRRLVGWVETAKRVETKERRLREAIALLAKRQRLGLK